jgi:hypothetical protein
MKPMYRLEVSYQTANGKFHRDREILQQINTKNEKAASGFGWRDLVFSFENTTNREKCLGRLSKLPGLRVTLYEINQ